MPLYDLQCQQCGGIYEAYVPLSSEAVPRCEGCGGEGKRILSFPARKTEMGDNSYPYVEHNFGEKPIKVESPDHRRSLMRELGLRDGPSPKWGGQKWV